MSAATSITDARSHHAKHGDMDGTLCLLNRCALHYPRGMAKRGYSREFPRRSDNRIKREIDWVPPTLDAAVQAKCKREGISLRALTLQLWKKWIEADE